MKKAKDRYGSSKLEKIQARYGYVFTFTIIIGMLFIFIPMFFNSFLFSINDISIKENGYNLVSVGFSYYKKFFYEDVTLKRQLYSSILSMFTDLICIIIFSIFIAVLLNQNFKGRTFARVVFFLPIVALSGVVAAVESQSQGTVSSSLNVGYLSSFSFADVTSLLENSNLNEQLVSFVVSAINRIYSIVTSSSVQMLIFLGGIQSIPYAFKEAALTEGCSGWEYFWKITFPLLSPYILVNSVFTIIMSFTSSSNTFISSVSAMGQTIDKFSYASAVSIIYFLIISLILLIVAGIISRNVKYLD